VSALEQTKTNVHCNHFNDWSAGTQDVTREHHQVTKPVCKRRTVSKRDIRFGKVHTRDHSCLSYVASTSVSHVLQAIAQQQAARAHAAQDAATPEGPPRPAGTYAPPEWDAAPDGYELSYHLHLTVQMMPPCIIHTQSDTRLPLLKHVACNTEARCLDGLELCEKEVS